MRLEQLLPDRHSSPSARVVANERTLQLARVLDELPEDYRQVITLRTLEELPHEEVARRMNRSSSAVRMLWLRALAELRQRIEAAG